tara:strand:+ start:330 stop:443 length:114 start_codon:yes stop_codon:yes gene_type:complete
MLSSLVVVLEEVLIMVVAVVLVDIELELQRCQRVLKL